MKFAIVGSHGLFANYGGWDQLVNNLATKKSEGIECLIFNPKETQYDVDNLPEGTTVVQLPLSGSGFQGILFDYLSTIISAFTCNSILFLGTKGVPMGLIVKILRLGKLRLVANVGGIEWDRPQFSFAAKIYLRLCTWLAGRLCNVFIIDNDHYRQTLRGYISSSEVMNIPYGAEIDYSILELDRNLIDEFSFINKPYVLSISRSIADNKIYELCNHFSQRSDIHCVVISNFTNSEYGKAVLSRFKGSDNLTLIDGLYDKSKLDFIRRNCRTYIHTHTLCGSAPSLIEMIACKVPIMSIDVAQNQFTLKGECLYFSDFNELYEIDFHNNLDCYKPSDVLAKSYNWDRVIADYERALY